MVKLFALLPRRADVSVEEFHDHYRHPHGTLGKEITGFRGYVQSHQMDTDLLGGSQARFEAVAEVWFDNAADAARLGEDPHYLEHVRPDEPNFIDMENLTFLFTTEDVVTAGPDPRSSAPLAWKLVEGMHVSRPITVKLLHFADVPGSLTSHSDLAELLGAFRYVRSKPHSGIHPDGAPFAEVHELWWPTRWDFEHGVSAAGLDLRSLFPDSPGSFTMLGSAERFI